jgi:hypothetical protein
MNLMTYASRYSGETRTWRIRPQTAKQALTASALMINLDTLGARDGSEFMGSQASTRIAPL